MTGPEHYREGEVLLAEAESASGVGAFDVMDRCLRFAEIHFLAASVAAHVTTLGKGAIQTQQDRDRLRAWECVIS